MIARVWRGWTRPENADAYDRLLRSEVLPGIHRIPGYRGAWLLRRDAGDEVEFVTITTWDSWEAIDQFAGGTGAVILPRAHELLSRYDEHATHYSGAWLP